MVGVKKFEKLPITIIPIHYNIHLAPDLQSFRFKGEVDVKIEVKTETDEIILNSLDLEFDTVQLKRNKEEFKQERIKFLLDEEKVVVKYKLPLSPGNYELGIKYEGKLNDSMRGFYRSKYVDDKGKEFYSAVSQFAPIDARRCFPCWDEPSFKATFDVILTTQKELTTLSNMSVSKTTSSGDFTTYHFNRSPKMSTYLAAFVVGNFDYVEKKSDKVLLRVYTPLQKKEQGEFALEVALKALAYYEKYFNIAYPLPKLDLIAVSGLSYGAMENWGLITYREQRLLIDSANSSTETKQSVALVVAHELAHQWFGNLVTMKWWTDLWLNEGYATFAQFLCINHLFPEYNVWSQFVNTTFLAALELDSLNNSHPIEVTVHNPSEINQIFDAITYSKGASIIRMLVDFIGDETFKKGMCLYLNRYQYGNTSTEDLWNALEEASKLPVAKIMSTWTKQMGFPLITVETSGSSNSTKVKLTQKKFTSDGSEPTEGFSWMVPISILSGNSSGKITKILLDGKSTEISISGVSSKNWIKVNPGVVGFYRTLYSNDMLEKFTSAIKEQTMASLDRLGLLEDIFALVKTGHMDTVTLLKFLKIYENETDSNVWISIINILNKLTRILEFTDNNELFYSYRKQLLYKIYGTIGWESRPADTHIDTLLRGKILEHFAELKDDEMIQEAKRKFSKHFKAEQILQADVRVACYKTVLSVGGEVEFELLLQLYKTTDLNEEKLRITRGLGTTNNEKLIKKLLDFAISDDVKTQDSVLVLISACHSMKGRDLTWEFIKNNWETITTKFHAGSLLENLIKQVCQNFATKERLEDIKMFFSINKNEFIDRSIKQVLESVSNNISWLERDSDSVKNYLSQ